MYEIDFAVLTTIPVVYCNLAYLLTNSSKQYERTYEMRTGMFVRKQIRIVLGHSHSNIEEIVIINACLLKFC